MQASCHAPVVSESLEQSSSIASSFCGPQELCLDKGGDKNSKTSSHVKETQSRSAQPRDRFGHVHTVGRASIESARISRRVSELW